MSDVTGMRVHVRVHNLKRTKKKNPVRLCAAQSIPRGIPCDEIFLGLLTKNDWHRESSRIDVSESCTSTDRAHADLNSCINTKLVHFHLQSTSLHCGPVT